MAREQGSNKIPFETGCHDIPATMNNGTNQLPGNKFIHQPE
jgi:hypothetical protein